MSDDPPNEPQEHNTAPQSSSTFVLSRENFDQIPGFRGRYIVLYLLILVWWIAPKALYLITEELPPPGFAAIYYVVFAGLYLPFYYYFGKTMKTMGYPIYWIAPTLLVVSVPIPGLLAMGYMDRKVADVWDIADDAHQSYRQRVYEKDEEEDEDDPVD